MNDYEEFDIQGIWLSEDGTTEEETIGSVSIKLDPTRTSLLPNELEIDGYTFIIQK